jgi:hypothetical protein
VSCRGFHAMAITHCSSDLDSDHRAASGQPDEGTSLILVLE